MSTSNLPVIRVHGRTFIEVDPEDDGTCTGCVAHEERSGHLCQALPECSGRTFSSIFKELT